MRHFIIFKEEMDMKTMEELYKEVMASEELQKELSEATKTIDAFEHFLKESGCDAWGEEFAAFLNDISLAKLNNDAL